MALGKTLSLLNPGPWDFFDQVGRFIIPPIYTLQKLMLRGTKF